MSILFTNYKQLKANSVKASTSSPAMPSTSASSSSTVSGDGGMERHLSRLREQAKAVITFAGMIPYRMPGTQAFFWTFRKKLKAKKTQAEKKLKQIFEKLKQIIQKLNNLPTKN